MEKNNPSTFDKLYAINVNSKTDTKGPKNLTYLAWASAWAIIKQQHPHATFTEYECVDPETNLVLSYFHDKKTAWVKVGTRIDKDGVEYVKTLPIMDYNYRSIPLEKLTSQDINTALQRCLVKSLAFHGLGLYIYEKDDLPEGAVKSPAQAKKSPPKPSNGEVKKSAKTPLPTLIVGDENWAKFVIYAKTKKTKLSIDEICKKASTKYKVSAAVKKELTKILKG